MLNIYKKTLQNLYNYINRRKLKNKEFTLVCSNCTGGFLYHWLGLKFNSPFINLYMSPADFLTALENFDEFLHTPFKEDIESNHPYPVGIGIKNTRVHFVHYNTFSEAIEKWEERKKRINLENMAIMLTNFHGKGAMDNNIVQRFEKLPFKHKVVFTAYPTRYKSAFHLKGFEKVQSQRNIYATQNPITCKRYIDQFNYVDFFNQCNI